MARLPEGIFQGIQVTLNQRESLVYSAMQTQGGCNASSRCSHSQTAADHRRFHSRRTVEVVDNLSRQSSHIKEQICPEVFQEVLQREMLRRRRLRPSSPWNRMRRARMLARNGTRGC
mmetsp:Transcript_129/g.279  ORF Transcript_129/g.279 Transcript_129/m.279 type:complete len:117 (+) Transcript_129:488-838(+)